MSRTPIEDGLTMPARYAPHERTWIAWPNVRNVDELRREYAAVARAIAPHEPVTLIVHPDHAASVGDFIELGDGIDAVEIPIDDASIRDNGPIFVTDGSGGAALVNFRFNGWGGLLPYTLDAEVPRRIAEALGMRCYDAPFILEGGGFTVDAEGTLITTEQFLLNPNRNAGWSREEIERGLHDYLGIEKTIWLDLGLVEDVGNGHSDNVVQFIEPGVVLLQTMNDRGNPNYELCAENLRRLREARDARGRKLQIVEMDLLPYTEPLTNPHGLPPVTAPTRFPVPYLNYYLVNGALIAPMLGGSGDEKARVQLQELYPDREIVGVPSTAIAVDGGGIGCITQQQPVGRPLR